VKRELDVIDQETVTFPIPVSRLETLIQQVRGSVIGALALVQLHSPPMADH